MNLRFNSISGYAKSSINFFQTKFDENTQSVKKTLGNLASSLLDTTYQVIKNPTSWFLIASQFIPVVAATSTEDDTNAEEGAFFSGTAFSLCLREMFEAAFMTSLVLQSINRARQREVQPITDGQKSELKKVVAVSAISGMAGAGALSSLLLYLFNEHAREEMGEDVKAGMEAVIKLLISVLVSNFSVEVLKMLSVIQNTERYDNAIDQAARAENSLLRYYHAGKIPASIFFIETIEAALLIGVSEENAEASTAGKLSIAGSGACGALISLMAVAFFHHFGERLSRNQFRYGTSGMMALIGGGTASYAVHEGQELQFFGPYGDGACGVPWFNKPLWDASNCCSDKENEFFKFLRTFLGYQDKPTALELIAWFARIGMTAKSVYAYMKWEREQIDLETRRAQNNQVELIEDMQHSTAIVIESSDERPLTIQIQDKDTIEEGDFETPRLQ